MKILNDEGLRYFWDKVSKKIPKKVSELPDSVEYKPDVLEILIIPEDWQQGKYIYSNSFFEEGDYKYNIKYRDRIQAGADGIKVDSIQNGSITFSAINIENTTKLYIEKELCNSIIEVPLNYYNVTITNNYGQKDVIKDLSFNGIYKGIKYTSDRKVPLQIQNEILTGQTFQVESNTAIKFYIPASRTNMLVITNNQFDFIGDINYYADAGDQGMGAAFTEGFVSITPLMDNAVCSFEF